MTLSPAFTPVPSTLGGLLLGASVCMLLLFAGRIAGISGIVANLWTGPRDERRWRWLFAFGLLFGGALVLVFHRDALPVAAQPADAAAVLHVAEREQRFFDDLVRRFPLPSGDRTGSSSFWK